MSVVEMSRAREAWYGMRQIYAGVGHRRPTFEETTMRFSDFRATCVILAVMAASPLAISCDKDEEPPVEDRLCERFDECTLLDAGVSVQDCIDNVSNCTDELVSSDRTDWNREIEECLENSNCVNFFNCYQNVPDC